MPALHRLPFIHKMRTAKTRMEIRSEKMAKKIIKWAKNKVLRLMEMDIIIFLI